jgi:hypothetical protein
VVISRRLTAPGEPLRCGRHLPGAAGLRLTTWRRREACAISRSALLGAFGCRREEPAYDGGRFRTRPGWGVNVPMLLAFSLARYQPAP